MTERKVVRAKRARVEAPGATADTGGEPQSALSLQGFLRELVAAYAQSIQAERKDLRMIRTLGIQPLLHILTFLRPSEAIGRMPRVSRSMAVALPPSALIVPELRIKWVSELPWPHLSRYLLHTRRLTLEHMGDAADALALQKLPKLVGLDLDGPTSDTTMYNALQSRSLQRLTAFVNQVTHDGLVRALRDSVASRLVQLHLKSSSLPLLDADVIPYLPVQLESLEAWVILTGDMWVQLLERCKKLHVIDLFLESHHHYDPIDPRLDLAQWTKPARRDWTRVELGARDDFWPADRHVPTAQARLLEWFANPRLVTMALSHGKEYGEQHKKHILDAAFWRTFLGRLSSAFESLQLHYGIIVVMDANDAKETPLDGGLLLSLLLTHTPRLRELVNPSYSRMRSLALVTDEATLARGMQNPQWTLLDGEFPHYHFRPPEDTKDAALAKAVASFAEQGHLTTLRFHGEQNILWTRTQWETILLAGRDWDAIGLVESTARAPWDAPLSDAVFAHLAALPSLRRHLYITGPCRPSKASLLALVPDDAHSGRTLDLKRSLSVRDDVPPSLGTTVDIEVLQAFYARPRERYASGIDHLEHGMVDAPSIGDDLVSWLLKLDRTEHVPYSYEVGCVSCLVPEAVASVLLQRLAGRATRWFHLSREALFPTARRLVLYRVA